MHRRSYKKNSKLDQPYQVKLHIPDGWQIVGPARASFAEEPATPIGLLNNEAEFDSDGNATFTG